MTHRSTTKLIKISNALLTQTKQGRLTWTSTENLDVFEVNFPDYSIRIAHRLDRRTTQTMGELGTYHKIEIYNNEGMPIEVATSDQMKHEGIPEAENITEVLAELYGLAKEQALGVDSALDELLSRLNSAA